jgi:putative DNA-invertase from lambdoid prophage Rac
MKAFLYARVSLADKDQNPEVQLREMREYCAGRKWSAEEFFDKMSGSKSNRPEFQRMLELAKRKKCDVVVVYRLSRFARSTRELVNWLDEFHALGIEFVSLHEAIDTSTPQGRLLFRIMAALAEFELDIIRENVRAGLAYARSAGKTLGRPQRVVDVERIATLRSKGRSWRQIGTRLKIKPSTARRAFLRHLNEHAPQTVQKPVEISDPG